MKRRRHDQPFTEIEHSGDIGIECEGADVGTLFQNAALGLFSLQRWGPVGEGLSRHVDVSSVSLDDLLVDWLNEVIAVGAERGDVYARADVTLSGPLSLRGTLIGERVDPLRHRLRFDVKAATYHNLNVVRRADGYFARVIFDL